MYFTSFNSKLSENASLPIVVIVSVIVNDCNLECWNALSRILIVLSGIVYDVCDLPIGY